MIGDKQQPVRAAEVEEALSISVLPQDFSCVQVAPFGKVFVDPVAFLFDEIVDLCVAMREGTKNGPTRDCLRPGQSL